MNIELIEGSSISTGSSTSTGRVPAVTAVVESSSSEKSEQDLSGTTDVLTKHTDYKCAGSTVNTV